MRPITQSLLNWANFALGVAGAIGLAISWYSAGPDSASVYYSVATRTVFSPDPAYPLQVAIGDKSIDPARPLTTSDVSFWNWSNNAVLRDDVRVPLFLSVPKLYSAQVVQQVTPVDGNFSLETSDTGVVLQWKAFDPDMVLKVRLLYEGAEDDLNINGSFGPRKAVERYQLNWLQIGTMGLLIILLGVVGVAGMITGVIGVSNQVEKVIANTRLSRFEFPVVMAVALPVIMTFILTLYFLGSVAAKLIHPPPPL